MSKFTVRFFALCDLITYVDAEAETSEQAIPIARAKLDIGNDPQAAFELADNGIDPIAGTIEPVGVDDANSNEVLSIPRIQGSDIAALFAPEGRAKRERLIEALRAASLALNTVPSTRVKHTIYRNTYEIAALVDNALRESGEL